MIFRPSTRQMLAGIRNHLDLVLARLDLLEAISVGPLPREQLDGILDFADSVSKALSDNPENDTSSRNARHEAFARFQDQAPDWQVLYAHFASD